jgi:hypothetical protein
VRSNHAALPVAAALATAGLLVAIVAAPSRQELSIGIYLGAIAALALIALVARISVAFPRASAPVAPLQLRPEWVAQLESVDRLLVAAEGSAADLHERLRPVLREVAATRLRRRGIALDREPERARVLLGERAWEIVRPDREPPADPYARGSSEAELREVVGALEAI